MDYKTMNKITIILDSHQLSAYQKCPRLFNYETVQQRGTSRQKEAFTKGKWIHNVLETYYNGRIDKLSIEQCVINALAILAGECGELTKEQRQLIAPRLIQYFAYYKDETWNPLKTELGFSILLYEDDLHLFVYEGKIDLIFEVQRTKMFADHKSQSWQQNLPQDSNQFLGYSWATELYTGVINFINLSASKQPKDAFRREICNYTPQLIQEWKEGVIETCLQMASHIRESRFPKRRSGCLGTYGLCDFINVCKQTSHFVEKGMLERDFIIKEPWSPWE
jgi:hypothetical protein